MPIAKYPPKDKANSNGYAVSYDLQGTLVYVTGNNANALIEEVLHAGCTPYNFYVANGGRWQINNTYLSPVFNGRGVQGGA